MNPDCYQFGSAVQRLLDEHMDTVERELAAAGKTRTDRRRICDDLEGQIREMLAERAPGNPTEGDLRAVLAELDKPEAYGEWEESDASGQSPHPAAPITVPHMGLSQPIAHEAAGAPQAPSKSDSGVKRFILYVVAFICSVVALLIFLPIFSIIAAIFVPNFLESQTRSKVARVHADQHSLATAIEAYFIDHKAYPAWTDREGSAFGELINLPVLQGQSTFRNPDQTQLNTLTMPVPYITSYPKDPSTTAKGAPVCYFSDDHTWIVWGTGPDGRYNLNLETVRALIDPITHQFSEKDLMQYTYDPTNGTNSAGDVYQYKGGGKKF